jgi:four helix bundle protein
LVVDVYRITQAFPKQETYGLSSQMRRAAVSIPSNIAEGKGRMTDRDRAHFFSQARGSLLELETQAFIAQELGFLSRPETIAMMRSSARTGSMLNALIQSIRPKIAQMDVATSSRGRQPEDRKPEV